MRSRSLACLLALALLRPTAASAQKLEKIPDKLAPEQLEARLRYRAGRVTLSKGLATLDLPPDFRYLDPQQTELVLRGWDNPPGSGTLGMVLPVGVGVFTGDGWGVIITYDEDGYVKDDDAAKIDYRDLLTKMQQATRDANEARAKLIAGGIAAKAGLFKVPLGGREREVEVEVLEKAGGVRARLPLRHRTCGPA